MAYMNTTAIQTRLREVLDGGAGTLRTIDSGRFDGTGHYSGQSIEAQGIRSLVKPLIEAEIVSVGRHPDSPPAMHSDALREVEVEIRVIRHAELTDKLTASTRDALKGLAAQDADVVAQALTFPGNLTSTAAGTATGLLTGLMMYTGRSTINLELGSESSARVVSTHKFRGIVRVVQAVA